MYFAELKHLPTQRSQSLTESQASSAQRRPSESSPTLTSASHCEPRGEAFRDDAKEAIFQDALCKHSCSEFRSIEIELTDGQITLHGQVSSFYLKQLAQETVRPYAIGLQIDNRIVVAR
ncbi:BON domain-containing protein [Stieleria sp. TO1_6]|nr:BON domain-containing protein [Stieleria tagensis]